MTARVAFICQWYAPEPVSQPGWIVGGLKGAGHVVEVLTGVPNYPTGEVQAGYKAWRPCRERLEDTQVTRAPLYPSHDQNPIKRVLNYLSWAVSSTFLGASVVRRNDVSLVYSSPATAALPAMVGHWLARTPYVLLIQDVWPDSVFSAGFMSGRISNLVKTVLTWFVNAAYRGAAHIVVISPGMVELLISRGVPQERISVVYNWVGDEAAVGGAGIRNLRHELGIGSDDLLVMYAGNHGPAQALETIIQATEQAQTSRDVHLVLIGDGIAKSELQAAAEDRRSSRVHFLPPVARSEIRGLMAQANVQAVSLARRELFAVTTPSKLQSVLASGQPVLVVADGDAAQFVRSNGAGIAAAAEDVDQTRSAIEHLASLSQAELESMGQRGRCAYHEQMSEAVGARRLSRILNNATYRGRGHS